MQIQPREIIIQQHRICLVNYEDILHLSIINLFEDIKWYLDLTQENKLNKPLKQFINHHIIYNLCEYLTNKKTNNKIVVYIPLVLKSQLDSFFDKDEIQTYLKELIVDMYNKLPIKMYFSPCDSAWTKLQLKDKANNYGFWQEQLYSIKFEVTKDKSKLTFSQIKAFASKHGLKFLNKQYFNNIKFSQISFV